MYKTITYSGFIIASLLVILVFVTSKTYSQLALGMILYPMLVYAAYKFFSNESWRVPVITVQIPAIKAKTHTVHPEKVADANKRTFLKLVGAAGVSLLVYSIFSRKIDLTSLGSGVAGLGSLGNKKIDLASSSDSEPMAGYKVSEIDENVITYYGFTNKDGDWIIMRENTENNSFRYAQGDSDYPSNWANREKLKYDYFDKVF